MLKGIEAVLAAVLFVSAAGCATHIVDSSAGGGVEASCANANCAATDCATTECAANLCAASTCSAWTCGTFSCSTSTCCTPTGCSCDTPLVLSFEGAPVRFVADDAHGFALSADESAATDWPTAATPWLALDRDGDGEIGDGAELFGSATRLEGGGRAKNGFEALAELDRNHDGHIDASDPGFADLVIWRDRNGDRRSTPDELEPAARSLVAIDIHEHAEVRCDRRGNCEVERAAFFYRTEAGEVHEGAIVDVHLRRQR